jgi:hypothetical protein
MQKEPLTSVLKNVPIDLQNKLLKYQTKPSLHRIRWKFRQPKLGYKFGWGGNLRKYQAQSADMYIDHYQSRTAYKRYNLFRMKNFTLTGELHRALGRMEQLTEALIQCEAQIESKKVYITFLEKEKIRLNRRKSLLQWIKSIFS